MTLDSSCECTRTQSHERSTSRDPPWVCHSSGWDRCRKAWKGIHVFQKGSHRYAGVSFFFTIDLSNYRHLFAVFLLVRFHWRRSRSRRRTSAFKREKIKKKMESQAIASSRKQKWKNQPIIIPVLEQSDGLRLRQSTR